MQKPRWMTSQKILSCCFFLPFFLFLLLGCQSVGPQGESVQIERITNQQALEIAAIAGQPEITEQVKLAGIAIPGISQSPWGEAAKTRLEQMTAQQSVRLEFEDSRRGDRAERSGYAWLKGELLNEKLVAEGYALAVSQFSNSKYQLRLSRAQDRARILGLGIWNPENPMRQNPAEVND